MKNSNHASKALAVVLSGALAFAPAANAALDDSNMAYTSAAEGFYGSLRVQYANTESGGEDNDSSVDADLSRLGVRGDIDIGGGLEAFYGFEWNLGGPANGDKGLNTRQHHVGLKGDWGSVWLGAFDSVIVRFGGFGTTDILDQYSGNFEPIYRTSNAIAYVSPDLNGFQFGVEVAANDGTKETVVSNSADLTLSIETTGGVMLDCDNSANGTDPLELTRLSDAVGVIVTTDDTNKSDDTNPGTGFGGPGCLGNSEIVTAGDDGNDFDNIGVGASYSIQGLTFSGAYYQNQDALGKGRHVGAGGDRRYQDSDDKGQYALGVSFKQDNWIVAAMYGGEDFTAERCVDIDTSTSGPDFDVCDHTVGQTGDGTFFSLAAGVSIDKLDIHGLWEQRNRENFMQFDGNNTAEVTDAAQTARLGGLVSNDQDTTIAAITARYHLGSKASLRAAWKNTETEVGPSSDDDTQYALGMRVDF